MSELDAPYALAGPHAPSFRTDGYVRLKNVLSAEILAEYGAEVTRVVRDTAPRDFMPPSHRELLDRDALRGVTMGGDAPSETYARAFIQRTNLWGISEKVARLVRSTRLAQIATELMGVAGVRLYHDQALFKEARGGHTPWHCDQYYWPLSNSNTVTAWIPLQAVPAEMGPVAFAKGSHRLEDSEGRALAISDDSEETMAKLLDGFEVDARPFDLGEVSFHSGWTFHRAEPNTTDQTRAAFTIIYMDRDIRVTEPRHRAQVFDRHVWMPGIEPGQVAASPINPILYER